MIADLVRSSSSRALRAISSFCCWISARMLARYFVGRWSVCAASVETRVWKMPLETHLRARLQCGEGGGRWTPA